MDTGLTGCSARRSISSQRYGAGMPSSERKRSRRLVIAITQEFVEPPAPAAEVRPYCDAVRAETGSDLTDWKVGVVEENHRGALRIRQLPKGDKQIGVLVA